MTLGLEMVHSDSTRPANSQDAKTRRRAELAFGLLLLLCGMATVGVTFLVALDLASSGGSVVGAIGAGSAAVALLAAGLAVLKQSYRWTAIGLLWAAGSLLVFIFTSNWLSR